MSALYFFSFLWLALCRAARPAKNIFGQNVTNWNDVTGQATGEFQLLGELYFPDDKKGKARVVQIDVVTKEQAPDSLRVLIFDNQPESFGMISRGDLGDSCKAKRAVSKSLTDCKPNRDCSHGLQINMFSHSMFGPDSDFCPNCHLYSQKIKIESHDYLAWYFVAAQCDGGAVKLAKYNIHSQQAGSLPSLPASYGDKTAIAGTTANGNFELLGSLCFFTGPVVFGEPSVNVTVTYDSQTPCCEEVSLLAYDDKGLDELFDSRASNYSFTDAECERREAMALAALPLRAGSNSHTWTIPFSALGSRSIEHAAIRLNFAVAHRSEANPPKVTDIRIHSPTAVNCNSKCPAFEDCGPVVVHGRNLRRA